MLGLGFLKLVHPDDLAEIPERWGALLAQGETWEAQYRLRRNDDEFRWHVIRGSPVKDARGTVLRWTGSCTDVHDMRAAVDEARDATELLRSMGGLTDALVFAKDEHGHMFLANDATLAVLGLSSEEVLGVPNDLLGGTLDQIATINAADAKVMSTGQVHVSEEPWTSPDGVTRIFRSVKGPWRRANGTVGMVGATVDISFERALEKRLVESEEKFQTVIDRLPVLAWMTDEQGHLTIKNTLWLDYLGLSGGAKDWATFENLIDPVEFGNYTKEWQACVALGHLLEREINLSDKLAGKICSSQTDGYSLPSRRRHDRRMGRHRSPDQLAARLLPARPGR